MTTLVGLSRIIELKLQGIIILLQEEKPKVALQEAKQLLSQISLNKDGVKND